MHGKAWQEIWLQVIQTSISGRKMGFTIITEENGDTLSAILIDKITTKFYRFFILDMISLKIA